MAQNDTSKTTNITDTIFDKTRGVAAGFGHHGMPPPGCNNIAAILLMSCSRGQPYYQF